MSAARHGRHDKFNEFFLHDKRFGLRKDCCRLSLICIRHFRRFEAVEKAAGQQDVFHVECSGE